MRSRKAISAIEPALTSGAFSSAMLFYFFNRAMPVYNIAPTAINTRKQNVRRPVSIHLEPDADKTSPSLRGVSVPVENKNATRTTAANAPIEINAF